MAQYVYDEYKTRISSFQHMALPPKDTVENQEEEPVTGDIDTHDTEDDLGDTEGGTEEDTGDTENDMDNAEGGTEEDTGDTENDMDNAEGGTGDTSDTEGAAGDTEDGAGDTDVNTGDTIDTEGDMATDEGDGVQIANNGVESMDEDPTTHNTTEQDSMEHQQLFHCKFF